MNGLKKKLHPFEASFKTDYIRQRIHLLHSLFIRVWEAGCNVLVADVASDFSASVASCLEDSPQKFCQITVQRVGGGAYTQG